MKYLIIVVFLFQLSCAGTQTTIPALTPVHPQMMTITLLPDFLSESSGLEMTAPEVYWSHNDHKGAAKLYAFDDDGTLLRTITVDNATNEDWEDLAQDEKGNFYIGDFGNNDNDRQDLKIYKIPNPETFTDNNVISEVINFHFQDQTMFPPSENKLYFDVEAMFVKGSHIFLLTRNRSKPFSGNTRLYQLLNEPGNQVAVLLNEFETDPKKNKGQITSADISPDGSKIAILANETLWIFKDFNSNDFFSGTQERIDLPWDYQMEAVVFQDNCTLFLTNEKQKEEVARLHRIRICDKEMVALTSGH